MHIGLTAHDAQALQQERAATAIPERTRLYGIGAGKTGTHALASMLSGFAAAHEAEAEAAIGAVLDYQSMRSGWRALRDFAVDRDRRLRLTVDVSNLNIFFVDLLVALSDTAKFVLTIRDPYSWVDSMINHYLLHPPTARWRALADLRFGKDRLAHPKEEQALKELGLYSLEGYLCYWRDHIRKALATVPAERLLVIRTERIASEADRVAKFAGISGIHVDRAAICEYRNPQPRHVLRRIPREHLESQVRCHCEPLLSRLFPDKLTPEDAGVLLRTTENRP